MTPEVVSNLIPCTVFATCIPTREAYYQHMKFLVALYVLGACADEPTKSTFWQDNRSVHVITVDLPDVSKQAFHHRVETDINRWRDALIAVNCPPPFKYISDETDDQLDAVKLVPNDQWVGHSVGTWTYGSILIRSEGDGTLDTYANDPTWTVGLHELGHALGLPHAEYIEGDPSIMTTSPMYPVDPDNPLPERDIRDAACVLGCGPC